MSLAALLGQTVQIVPVSDGAADEFGNPVDSDGAGVSVAARLQRVSATEDTVDRDVADSLWVMYVDSGTAIDRRSRVVYGASTFEVYGTPYRVPTPSGEHHVKVTLRLIEGG